MIRVLLIIEDYNESSFLQITLKKLGVDVETNLNPYTLSNTILSFQPQMVLLTAKGKKINGLKVAIDIKKSKTNSKLVFVKKTGQDFVDKLLQDGAIDGMLVSPISPANVIELLARSFDLDETELKEKFLKSQSSKSLASDENEVPIT